MATLSAIALLLGAPMTMGMAQDRGDPRAQPQNQHCPQHQSNPKVEAEGDPAQADETVTVDGEDVQAVIDGTEVQFFDGAQGDPREVEYCIKAATGNSGRQEGSSGEVTWTNRGGQTPDISYVVVYGTEGGTPNRCPGDDHELTVQPSNGVNRTGTPHTMVATVTDRDGNPCEGAGVRFEVDDAGDPDPTEGSDTTDEFGEAYFTFTNTQESVNIITACTNDDGSLPEDCADADERDRSEKTWDPDGCPGPGPDGSLELTPATATNPVGTDHEVTAKVEEADGTNCQGVQVRFEVDDAGDPTPTHGHDITGPKGEADFTFTNSEAVTNTITACTNDDGSLPMACDEADHVDTATKTWEDTVVTPAMCRSRVVSLNDAALVLFEANPDGTPCMTADGSLVNEGQARLGRAETNGDETSADAEMLGLGGQEGDPGEATLLGSSADCDGQDAWIFIVRDGEGAEVLRVGDGGDVEVPDLEMDENNGIFITEVGDGKAQAVAVRVDGTELVVIGEAEAHCA